jgi:hypothetical protein
LNVLKRFLESFDSGIMRNWLRKVFRLSKLFIFCFMLPRSPAIFHAYEEKEIRSGHVGRTWRARHSQSNEKYIYEDWKDCDREWEIESNPGFSVIRNKPTEMCPFRSFITISRWPFQLCLLTAPLIGLASLSSFACHWNTPIRCSLARRSFKVAPLFRNSTHHVAILLVECPHDGRPQIIMWCVLWVSMEIAAAGVGWHCRRSRCS